MKRNRALKRRAGIVNPVLLFVIFAFVGTSLLMASRIDPGSIQPTSLPTQAPTITPTSVPLPSTIDEIKSTCSQGECVQACLAHVDQEFKEQKFPTPYYSGEDVTLVYYGIKDDELVKPRKLKVPADLIPLQENATAHRHIWDYFRSIIPSQSRPHLVQFVFYVSSTSDGLFDDTLYDDWLMYYDLLAQQDAANMTDILVHEYGHYLTLNRAQRDWESRVCHTEAIYGCEKPDAYLNLFYLQFWKDIYPEWKKVKYESKTYEKDVDLFYEKYKDRFINDYAATDPIEDIAESWNAFIVRPTPSTATIADQKIKFFYQFPELVKLRYQILKGICTYKPAS